MLIFSPVLAGESCALPPPLRTKLILGWILPSSGEQMVRNRVKFAPIRAWQFAQCLLFPP